MFTYRLKAPIILTDFIFLRVTFSSDSLLLRFGAIVRILSWIQYFDIKLSFAASKYIALIKLNRFTKQLRGIIAGSYVNKRQIINITTWVKLKSSHKNKWSCKIRWRLPASRLTFFIKNWSNLVSETKHWIYLSW